jgi:AcrR family transcriptional regulator
LDKAVKLRRYSSSLRAEQARDTRRRIRAAAETLFLDRGYSDVSMDEIARSAGVARQTVFSAYGTKAKLLKEVLDVRLAGDDEPVALSDRPAVQRVLTASDPMDAVRSAARVIVDVNSRVAPLWLAVTEAEAFDPEIAELIRSYDEARHSDIGRVVDVVANLGALRRGRSRAKAKDAVFLLTDPDTTYKALKLGWSPTDLERWYTDCLAALLLR